MFVNVGGRSVYLTVELLQFALVHLHQLVHPSFVLELKQSHIITHKPKQSHNTTVTLKLKQLQDTTKTILPTEVTCMYSNYSNYLVVV